MPHLFVLLALRNAGQVAHCLRAVRILTPHAVGLVSVDMPALVVMIVFIIAIAVNPNRF